MFGHPAFKSMRMVPDEEPDEIERFFLLNHVYLLETNRLLLQGKEYYGNQYLDEREILDNIEKFRSPHFVDPPLDINEFGAIAAHLNAHGYIHQIRMIEKGEKDFSFIKVLEKGMKAMLCGEFHQLQDRRRMEMENLKLTKRSIKAHAQQKFINWALTIATILAAISPIIVAEYYPPTVNVPVQESRPDIRIDTVWLRSEIEAMIQRSIPSQPQGAAKEPPPPTKGKPPQN